MPARIEGAIFDVDGVLVDSPHEKAWRQALRELMEGDWRELRARTSWAPDAFTSRVYEEEVAGKPRARGAEAVLAYFHVPDDERGTRVAEYAERKQALILDLIAARDFHAYPDALRLIIAVKEAGVRTAAASASKNASLFLRQIRLDTFAREQGISAETVRAGQTLLDYVDIDVSGRDFGRGKPDPGMFLAAAAELGVAPERALVVEDAPAGVEAAKRGGMCAVGIARLHDEDLLARAGADVIVTSLDQIDRRALADGRVATTIGAES